MRANNWLNWSAAASVALFLISVCSAPLHAQEWYCNACYDVYPWTHHEDECGRAIWDWWGSDCDDGWHDGPCGIAHNMGTCMWPPPDSDDPVDDLLSALEKGEIRVLASLVQLNENVEANDERNSVQVIGCGGSSVVANITLSRFDYQIVRGVIEATVASNGAGVTATGGYGQPYRN